MDYHAQLAEIVGEECVTAEESELNTYGQDWTRFHQPAPSAIVFPRTVSQVQQIARFANGNGIALVPSGGRTGMSGGALAINGEVVVSFDRMNTIRALNTADATVVVEAGVITAQLQQFAADNNLYYPVDFGSSGSSQIGGNIATNAGGIRVIRYGMTRNWVAGLKVVTGTGEILDLNAGLVKNNTGYDLRHLFIGSEGTLGFIVEATMKLTTAPKNSRVMLLAIPAMDHCLSILETFRQQLTLNAFEFLSDDALKQVLAASDLSHPMKSGNDYYVLIEFEESGDNSLELAEAAFSSCLEQGIATEGIIASSEAQNQQLWQYRDRITESITPRTPYKNDIAVRPSQIPEFLRAVNDMTRQQYPEFEIIWFGHIGDGNLHLNILRPEEQDPATFKTECDNLNVHILSVVQQFQGSVSAEHGIGLLKRDYLPYTRSETEIRMLKALKEVFDPAGIMNPGKLF